MIYDDILYNTMLHLLKHYIIKSSFSTFYLLHKTLDVLNKWLYKPFKLCNGDQISLKGI